MSFNPLLQSYSEQNVTEDSMGNAEGVSLSKRDLKKRMVYDERKKRAADILEGWGKGEELFAFTKGQISLIQFLDAIIDVTGPAELSICTWTAASTDVTEVMQWLKSGRVTGARWLVDLTFQNRAPELAQQIRQLFGYDAIRVSRVHAKFQLIKNENWRVVVRTSMNLNKNPRMEDITIAHDPELFDWIDKFFCSIWDTTPPELGTGRPQEVKNHFNKELNFDG